MERERVCLQSARRLGNSGTNSDPPSPVGPWASGPRLRRRRTKRHTGPFWERTETRTSSTRTPERVRAEGPRSRRVRIQSGPRSSPETSFYPRRREPEETGTGPDSGPGPFERKRETDLTEGRRVNRFKNRTSTTSPRTLEDRPSRDVQDSCRVLVDIRSRIRNIDIRVSRASDTQERRRNGGGGSGVVVLRT